MECGVVLSVQGLGDWQLSRLGVNDEDANRSLVSTTAGHAVSEGLDFGLFRSDLWRLMFRVIYLQKASVYHINLTFIYQ